MYSESAAVSEADCSSDDYVCVCVCEERIASQASKKSRETNIKANRQYKTVHKR